MRQLHHPVPGLLRRILGLFFLAARPDVRNIAYIDRNLLLACVAGVNAKVFNLPFGGLRHLRLQQILQLRAVVAVGSAGGISRFSARLATG